LRYPQFALTRPVNNNNWLATCWIISMSRNLTNILGCFLGAMLLASIGGFLFYVPAVSWITFIVVVAGMVLMFLLGMQTGARRIRWSKKVQLFSPGKTMDDTSLRRAG
jgi:uncharacterized membrane protein YedE/YeeE